MEELLVEGLTVSVILKEREQIIVAAAGKVRRIQVGQKIIWIHQVWQQLQEGKPGLMLRKTR